MRRSVRLYKIMPCGRIEPRKPDRGKKVQPIRHGQANTSPYSFAGQYCPDFHRDIYAEASGNDECDATPPNQFSDIQHLCSSLNITSSETINPKVDQMLDLKALFHQALRQPQCQPHWSVICDDSFHVVGVCNARVRKKVVGAACMVRVVF